MDSVTLCRHFGECGGCAFQNVGYEEQVGRKSAWLGEVFGEFWGAPIEVVASPVAWHYRNKVDFNFAPKRYDEVPPEGFERETVLGFTRKGKWYWPLDISECLIGPGGMDGLLAAVRGWYRETGLRGYDSKRREGFLRVLLVREGVRTGERMVVLITTEGELDGAGFVEAVLGGYPATSVQHGVYGGVPQGSFADELHVLHGPGTMEERLRVPDGDAVRELRFRISPLSFFQTNTRGAEVLYGLIRDWAREVSPRVLYDLYGGAGGIAFACSDLVEVVRSVEQAEAATADGEFNAGLNGIENVFFTNQDMRHYMRAVADTGGMERGSAVVLDPPRAGLHPKVVKGLVERGPGAMLYVSCKPEQLASEMPMLLEAYELYGMNAVDLFPHTPHVEALAAFRRR